MRLPASVRTLAWVGALAVSWRGAAADNATLSLSLPIACEPGKTCFLQSHVDAEPGPEARDFACGSATYDGHKGTDFRVLSSAAARGDKVPVLAAADGTVMGGRDGMEDVLVEGPDAAAIKDRECGNGVVISHGGGWETQYCHMLKGSVGVKNGDAVRRGQKLGLVGYSGFAEFAHVHLSVRKDGKVIDPYTGAEPGAACAADPAAARGLWTVEALEAFPYVNGEIIGSGFFDHAPTSRELETDHRPQPLKPGAAEIYFVARVANVRSGDRVRVELTGPGGFKQESSVKPLDRNRAMHLEWVFARTGRGGPLPAGIYRGKAELVRDGKVLATREAEQRLGS